MKLSGLALCAVLIPAFVGGSGCIVRGGAFYTADVYVESEPPPPRYVVVRTRPGYVWVQGRWVWRGGRWVWRDGYYVRERPGYVYSQGRWERRGGRYVWVDGTWSARGRARRHYKHHGDNRGGVVRRDHRDDSVRVRSKPAKPSTKPKPPKRRDHRDD